MEEIFGMEKNILVEFYLKKFQEGSVLHIYCISIPIYLIICLLVDLKFRENQSTY